MNISSPKTTLAILKGLKVWEVGIKNNYFNGQYPTYTARSYPVIAASSEEAKQIVLQNSDAILKELANKKFRNRRRLLPKKSTIPITDKEIAWAVDGTIRNKRTTHNHINLFSSDGILSVKVKCGNIIDIQQPEEH